MTGLQASFPGQVFMLKGVVRRFCACGSGLRCECELPQPRTRWTVERLAELRELMRDHGSVAIAAARLDETVNGCNLALDALMSRTPAHALAVLEAKKTRP